jgi:hypothetical protein
MNERVQETGQLEALVIAAPPAGVSTVHLLCVKFKET